MTEKREHIYGRLAADQEMERSIPDDNCSVDH